MSAWNLLVGLAIIANALLGAVAALLMLAGSAADTSPGEQQSIARGSAILVLLAVANIAVFTTAAAPLGRLGIHRRVWIIISNMAALAVAFAWLRPYPVEAIVFACPSVLMVLLAMWPARSHPPDSAVACAHCGYDLSGHTSGPRTCPECGSEHGGPSAQ